MRASDTLIKSTFLLSVQHHPVANDRTNVIVISSTSFGHKRPNQLFCYQFNIIRSLANSPPLACSNFFRRSDT